MDLEQTAISTSGLPVPSDGEISEYREMGRRYARKLVGCEADCDEIVQEVFCRLLARPRTTESAGVESAGVTRADGRLWDGPIGPAEQAESSWAATPSPGVAVDSSRWIGLFIKSVRNLCIDRLRQRAVRAASPLPPEGIGRSAPPHPLDLAEERERLGRAISGLPERWRTALLMRVDEELGYEQIAERMKASKAQVRTWIFRARQHLLQQLQA